MSKSYFSNVAEQWDQMRAGMYSDEVRTAVLKEAAINPDAVVADIGAGTGFLAQAFAGICAEVHVIENSPEMLAIAKRNLSDYHNIIYHQAEGESLPIPADSLDLVAANMYLHHVQDPQEAIQEMYRVVKPGGRLVITDLDNHSHDWLRVEQDDVWLGFDRNQIHSWFEEVGFVNVRLENTNQTCSATASNQVDQASISIFLAVGMKPHPQMTTSVMEHYRKVAKQSSSCCSTPSTIPVDSLLTSEMDRCCDTEQANTPTSLSLGCGQPVDVAELKPGEVVLDIGSGAGADVFPAADQVGKNGKVIGLDLVEEMLERARKTAQTRGYTNVEFRRGDALAIPLEDNSVDVVISNCVINLVQDKGVTFREAYRVLRPGGRISISDIVTDRPFSVALSGDPESWSSCISGAITEDEYLKLITQAGFINITTNRSQSIAVEGETKVFSLQVKAFKPTG